MRSAETSGVTAKADSVLKSGWRASRTRVARAVAGLPRSVAAVSPVTLAVTSTALVAAVLFVLYDISRSFDEARAITTLFPGQEAGDAWAGVLRRATLATMIALAAAALCFRRRGNPAMLAAQPLQEFIAALPIGVALWSPEGRLVAANAAYGEQLQREGTGLGADRCYREAVRQLTAGGQVQVVADGEASRILELHREDGICLLLDERPLEGGGFVTLVTDITERKRTDLLLEATRQEQRQLARRYHEEKLKAEAASRAKTSFLAHLSHDIRTPLNHIIGFADLIHQQTYGPLGDARYLGYVEMIKASGDKLLNSFASILELAEFESGTRPLREEPVEIDDLMRVVTRRFSAQAGRAGLALALGAPCEANLVADRFCLERMLGNLVENAIRFTPSGGRVLLAAYAADDGVVLEISDTGIGMSEEQLQRLSQPFVFGDAAFTREHQGAGLGIAISRAIAELSGGRLLVDSRPALGTTVAISLPLQQQLAAPARAA